MLVQAVKLVMSRRSSGSARSARARPPSSFGVTGVRGKALGVVLVAELEGA